MERNEPALISFDTQVNTLTAELLRKHLASKDSEQRFFLSNSNYGHARTVFGGISKPGVKGSNLLVGSKTP